MNFPQLMVERPQPFFSTLSGMDTEGGQMIDSGFSHHGIALVRRAKNAYEDPTICMHSLIVVYGRCD